MWKTLTTACVASILSTAAVAQSSEWRFQGSLYLFAAETDITVGDVEGTLSFSDALDNLDFAGMAAFRATNDQWTFIGDLMYFNLGFENDLSRPVFNRLDTDQRNTIFSGYALYRVYETQTAVLDLGGGFRYFNTDTELTLRSDVVADRRLSTDDNWTDPILAAQANFELSDTWGLMVAADYGSFIDDRTTYSVTATLDYAFNENWIGRIGYRYINVEDDDGDADFRFEQSGPMLGVSYRF